MIIGGMIFSTKIKNKNKVNLVILKIKYKNHILAIINILNKERKFNH
jgi:hypothetical protein